MSSVLLAAAFVAAAATGASAINCPSNIPAITASITQDYQGSTSAYMWSISPTAQTTIAPAGATACAPTYIGQYENGACVATVNQVSKEPSTLSGNCEMTFSDGGSRTMVLSIACDSTATTLTMENTVKVTNSMSGLVYSFKGAYSGVCGDDPGPGPGPSPDNGGGGGSSSCGGGCVFVIIFFVGAFLYVAGTVAFNYFKAGKRGKELAPHPEFWLMIPGLIKDGVLFTGNLITSPCRKSDGGSTYTQV